MSNKWYIGQEIVCIKKHSKNAVKLGEIYKIKGLSNSKCKCSHDVLIDVGIAGTSNIGRCKNCNTVYNKSQEIWWLSEVLFAPLEYNQDEINRVLEITIKEKL